MAHAPSANAAPCCPPATWSFYVYPGDSFSLAYTIGCNQANADGQFNHDSVVILDFGAQRIDGSGTYLPSTQNFWDNGHIEFYAANYALGYQQCGHGSHTVILGIGTNNSGASPTGWLGAVWGTVVQAVKNNASSAGYVNVFVAGAGDWESWGSFSNLLGWVNGDAHGGGYISTQQSALYNFGSADGCPGAYGQWQNLPCAGDWTQDKNWFASWGWPVAWSTPEVYYNGCNGTRPQNIEWGMISLEGANFHSQPIQFTGPFTSNATCDNSVNAWIDLYNVINNNPLTAMTPGFLLQIHTV